MRRGLNVEGVVEAAVVAVAADALEKAGALGPRAVLRPVRQSDGSWQVFNHPAAERRTTEAP